MPVTDARLGRLGELIAFVDSWMFDCDEDARKAAEVSSYLREYRAHILREGAPRGYKTAEQKARVNGQRAAYLATHQYGWSISWRELADAAYDAARVAGHNGRKALALIAAPSEMESGW